MNRFLTPLTNVIINRNGTIDKYMGDAIMAFWNAPLDDERTCSAGLRGTALAMQARLVELNEEWKAEAEARGGAHSRSISASASIPATASVGNFGSDAAFHLFVPGRRRQPRVAPRRAVQDLRRRHHHRRQDRMQVTEKFAILELDLIMVKGKKEPEVIYTIAGREDTAQSGRFQRLRNLTIEMLACYRSRDWEGALMAIERGRRTDDGRALELLYNLYQARIQGYQENPPPEDWNGAFALLTK